MPRGFLGKDSSIRDFCTWLPNTILKQIQEHEEVSYLLNQRNPEGDLTRNENKAILEWKSRNLQKANLVAVHPSSEVKITPDGNYAIVFHKNLYRSQLDFIETTTPGYGYLCITFRVDGDGEQVLITNHKTHDKLRQCHEISVTATEIIISGYLQNNPIQIPIQHNCQNWTTFFLDYTTHESVNTSEFTYILNNDPKMQGSFTLQRPRASQPGVYVGSRKDGSKPFVGSLHGFETYFTSNPSPIPQSLKELIIKAQQINIFLS